MVGREDGCNVGDRRVGAVRMGVQMLCVAMGGGRRGGGGGHGSGEGGAARARVIGGGLYTRAWVNRPLASRVGNRVEGSHGRL